MDRIPQVPLVMDFLWEGEAVIRRVRVGPPLSPGLMKAHWGGAGVVLGDWTGQLTSLWLSFLM